MRTTRAETTVDLILARIARDAAGRRLVLSLVGGPALASVWVVTCAAARRLEAGRLELSRVDYQPIAYLWNHVWIALHQTFGMAGLHVFFGVLLAAIAGLGAQSWARRRAIERRVGPEVLREWQLAPLRAVPELAEHVAAAERSPRPTMSRGGGLAAVVRVVRVLAWLVPFAAVALTLALVWRALTR